MNFVGKILVVVVVVLSVCFMAFAGAVYSVQESWRAEALKVRDQLTKAQSDLSAANQRLTALEAAATAAVAEAMPAVQKLQQALPQENPMAVQNQLQQLEALPPTDRAIQLLALQSGFANQLVAVNSNLTTQVETLQGTLGTVTTERDRLQTAADVAQQEANARLIEAKAQRERVKTLETANSELVAQVRKLETEIFHRDVDVRQMSQKQESLLETMASLQQILSVNRLSPDPEDHLGKQAPPPDVEGKVLNTREGGRGKSDLIEVSLGSDDGLKVGHSLYVYRLGERGKYLGQITIIYVTPDRAVGAVAQKAPNGVIEKGDYVTTKL